MVVTLLALLLLLGLYLELPLPFEGDLLLLHLEQLVMLLLVPRGLDHRLDQ